MAGPDIAELYAIFKKCRALPESQRATFLDSEVKEPGVRSEIERLLEIDSADDSFPVAPVELVAGTLDQPITEGPGTVIGPYKLLQQIGEGGMGVVYMAEQSEPVERRVALKIIKPGMDTRQVIARFEAERQALAMMDHPNISKVLDAGTTDSGRPYFVMELVKGIPLTKYCDQQHLTPKERLELFIPVCQAVQHAHQKGIIHRDLKPSNVLIALYDGQPVPKVIDFGVAKATGAKLTDKTMFTHYGQIVGTLEYMSPEQANLNQLDIDTRSDIYSLGVLLYELLTGATPLDRERLRSAAFEEMMRIIREEEPPKPSTRLSSTDTLPSVAANRKIEPKKLSVLVRGELDWIVMKALEKDRTRRYETATGFANDIQRYLNDEAVVACPPSAAYRFRKFARRNQGQLAAASVLALALLVAVGGVGWAVRDGAAQRAEVVRQRVARQQRITTQVELLLADADRHAAAERWEDALATAVRARAVLAGSNVTGAVSERVEATLQELEFVARLVEIRIESAVSLRQYIERPAGAGETAFGGVDHSAAALAYRTAFREFGVDVEALPAAESLARLRRHPRIALPLAIALDVLAYHLYSPGADETAWRPMLDLAGGLDPNPLRDQLRALRGQEVTPELQSALRELVDAFEVQKHGAETAIGLASALARAELPELQEQILRQAQQVFPGDYWLNRKLGSELLHQPPYAEATRFMTAALAIKPSSVAALINLGVALSDQGKVDEAIACYRTAIELNPNYAGAYSNLGVAFGDQGKLDEAIACYRTAIELNPNYPLAHTNLGRALADQGKLDEAIACHRKAIQLDPNLAYVHHGLGNALRDQGKLDEAIACYRKAIEVGPKLAYVHNNLGYALADQDKLDEAIACYRKAIELDPKHVPAHNNLGVALAKQNKLDDAIACYRKAIELAPDLPLAHNNLGVALADQGKVDEAIACYRKAIELDPKYVTAHGNLGYALAKQNKLDDAIACYRKALELNPNLAYAHSDIGVALADQGKLDEAIACYRKAIELDPNLAYAHSDIGVALADQGKLDEAIACYRKAIELDPKYAAAYNNLGNALKAQGKLDEAIACYRTAIELNPKYAGAYNNLGNALKAQGKLDEAIACYRKAIELNPNYPPAHSNLGAAFGDQGKLDEAIACYRTAIELNPNYPPAHYNLGNVLRDQGKLDEAIACYRKAIELDPKLAPAHNNLGLVFADQGRYPEAEERITEVLDIRRRVLGEEHPDTLMSMYDLANVYSRQSRYNEAEELYLEVLDIRRRVLGEEHPDTLRSMYNLANVYSRQSRYNEAEELRRDMFQIQQRTLGPEHPDTLGNMNSLAEAILWQGRCADAAPIYRSLLEIVEKLAASDESCRNRHRCAYSNLAWILATDPEMQDPDEAIRLATIGVELMPKGADPWNTLGMAQYRKGNWNAAIDALNKSVKLNYGEGDGFFFMAMAHWQLDNKDEARQWYGKGIAWMKKRGTEELIRLRDEAEQLMGITEEDRRQMVEEYFFRQVEDRPRDAQVWSDRANWYQQQGANDKAIEDYSQAIKLNPDDSRLWQKRTIAYNVAGQFDLAVKDATKAIELDPTCTIPFVDRAWAHYGLGEFQKGIADCDQAIHLDPNSFWGYERRAWGRNVIGDFEAAIADAERAIEIDPNNFGPYRRLATAHAALQQWDKALSAASAAIRLNPGAWEAVRVRADAYLKTQQYDKAIADLSELIRLNPKDGLAYNKRADAYLKTQQYDKAIADLSELIRLNPKDGLAYNKRADAYLKMQQYDEAIADASEAIRLDPNNTWVYTNRAKAYLEMQQYDEAIADASEAIRLDSNNTWAYTNRARAYLEMQQYDEAIADTSEAIHLNPTNGWIRMLRAQILLYPLRAHLVRNDFDQAIADCNETIRHNSDDWSAYVVRARVYVILTEYEKAAADALRATEIMPTFAQSWLNCLDIEFARGASPEATSRVVAAADAALDGPLPLEVAFHYAAWNLLLNRRGEYEKICRDVAAEYADPTVPQTGYLVARAAALTNKPVLDTKQLVEMASRAVEAAPNEWNEHNLGLCLLRDGQADAAIQRFNNTLRHQWDHAPLAWLGLAIAHAGGGRDVEAQEWLGKAQEWFKQHPLDLTSEMWPETRIMCQLLLREAEQLIEGKSSPEAETTAKTTEKTP